MKRNLIFILLALAAWAAYAVPVIFYTETFGTIGDATDAVLNWETNNNFDVDPLTYSTTTPNTVFIDGIVMWALSDTYPGGSGTASVRLDNGAADFLIEGIDTSAYTNISLSLLHFKRSLNSPATEPLIEVSADGVIWMPLSYTRTTNNVWELLTPIGASAIPSTTNLRIRFSKSSAWFYRIDDIKLTGERDENVPVALSSFTAMITSQNFVNLTWITQSEINVSGYYIYRSQDNQLSNAMLISALIDAHNSPTQQIYTFTDSELNANDTYYYWLQSIDLDGTNANHGPVSVYFNAHGEYILPEVPQATELGALFPNPFNPLVFIPYSLDSAAHVNISVYNSRGQLQHKFDLGVKAAGNYTISWDGTDLSGRPVSSGVYNIVMSTGKGIFTRKAVLLK